MAEYDVFISFKNTDENGNPTVDSKMAKDLHRTLEKKGIKAFFSNYSIEELGESAFYSLIFQTLAQTTIFVAVGTTNEYFESNWPKRERTAFILRNARKGTDYVFSYVPRDFHIDNLPIDLEIYQMCNHEEDIVNFIENKLKSISKDDGKNITKLKPDSTSISKNKFSSTNSISFEVGSIILNRYTLLCLIGVGGISQVYLALDAKLNRTVAIKITRKPANMNYDIIKSAFLTEIDIIKRLHHQSIVKIHDIDISSDYILIVMDYIEGEPLSTTLEQKNFLSQDFVISIAKQLCDVLTHLHSQNPVIVYRDIKPANIILQPDNKIKLIDFGIAREYKPEGLADTVCLGTIGYAAPEQFGGMGQSDARTDIYALGVTLNQLVTGVNPCEPPFEILPIREINPDLSAGLEYIIMKCTHKNPEDRFQSAEEVLQALNNIDSLTKKMNRKNFFQNISNRKNKSKKPNSQMPPRVSNPPVMPSDFSIPSEPANITKSPVTPSTYDVPTEPLPTEDELIKPIPIPVEPYAETTLLDKSVRQASANDFVKTSNQEMFVDAVAQVRLCVCSYQIDDEEIISAFIFSNNNKQQLLERLKKLSAKLLIKPSKPFVVRPYDVLTLATNGSLYCEFCWTGSVCETTICEPFRTIGIYHYGKKLAKISLDS